jgi:hypothetical protein
MGIEILNLGKYQKWVILANLFYLCVLMTILNYNIIPVNVSLEKVGKT